MSVGYRTKSRIAFTPTVSIVSDADLTRSERLAAVLRAEIQSNGPVSFEYFMQRALYEPGLGYYAHHKVGFAAQGDFVTAPTLTPLFAECLAEQCAELLAGLAMPCLLEYGAGDGQLAAALWPALKARGVALDAYIIVEASAALEGIQQRRLQNTGGPFRWCRGDELPEFQGVIIANEVLDAMPCQRFELAAGSPWELGVGCNNGEEFHWQRLDTLVQADHDLMSYLRELPDGYRSEYNRRVAAWLRELSGRLERGAILIFDYGYTRPDYYRRERSDGTLTCHYQHHMHSDPLILPGLQDITAWVDFTLAARSAEAAELEVVGFTPQAQFLLACGIAELLQVRRDAPGWSESELDEAKYLLMPNAMGERFKVLALARGLAQRPKGFSLRDFSNRL